MMQSDLVPTDDTEARSLALEQAVKYLCERSLQLQEYSRRLKEQSQEINRRVRSCLNAKRAA
jgi:hypothetical protein